MEQQSRFIVSIAKFILIIEIIALLFSIVFLVGIIVLPGLILLSAFLLVPVLRLLLIFGILGIIIYFFTIKKNKKIALWLLVVSSLSLLFGGYDYITHSKKNTEMNLIKQQEETVAGKKYDQLFEKLQHSQKIIGMDRSRFVINGPIYVELDGLLPSVYQKNPTIDQEIQKFGESIIGKEINIELLQTINDYGESKTYKQYFMEHSDYENPIITADIFFNGESLNKKFGLK